MGKYGDAAMGKPSTNLPDEGSPPLDTMATLMWDLDDKNSYFKLVSVTIPHAYTWGSAERDKREDIRKAVAPHLPRHIPPARWWAFRLYARKTGNRWDVENIPKLVVDAFSREQIDKDRSAYP